MQVATSGLRSNRLPWYRGTSHKLRVLSLRLGRGNCDEAGGSGFLVGGALEFKAKSCIIYSQTPQPARVVVYAAQASWRQVSSIKTSVGRSLPNLRVVTPTPSSCPWRWLLNLLGPLPDLPRTSTFVRTGPIPHLLR